MSNRTKIINCDAVEYNDYSSDNHTNYNINYNANNRPKETTILNVSPNFIQPHDSVNSVMNNQQNSSFDNTFYNTGTSFNNYSYNYNVTTINNNYVNNVKRLISPSDKSLSVEPKLQPDYITGIDFATLIDEIAEELSSDKLVVKELSFILRNKPQRSEIEHLDVKGLLNCMLKDKTISEHNMDILEQYANSIGKTTIVEKIQKFEKQPNNTTPSSRSTDKPHISYPAVSIHKKRTSEEKDKENNIVQLQPSKRARNELYHYPMHLDKTHGVCLIINNVTFNSPHLIQRTGSDVDVENLNRVFNKLKYIVDIHNDLVVSKMVVVAEKYSKEVNHSKYDSFVCCILTHGSNDGILYGTDGREIKLNDILQMFHSSRCQSLSGKPKIFIIQACRGDKEDVGRYQEISSDSASTGIEKSKVSPQIDFGSKIRIDLPDMSDFLVAYTTAPGYVSWRSKSEGTWYITELCDLLATKHKKYDLMTILTEVNNRIASRKTSQGSKQMPAPITYLQGLINIS